MCEGCALSSSMLRHRLQEYRPKDAAKQARVAHVLGVMQLTKVFEAQGVYSHHGFPGRSAVSVEASARSAPSQLSTDSVDILCLSLSRLIYGR